MIILTGADLIAEERQRQRDEEGYTAAHDAQFVNGELGQMAACYCKVAGVRPVALTWPANIPRRLLKRKGYPNPKLKDLVRAGALIAAEIDRVIAATTSVHGASE